MLPTICVLFGTLAGVFYGGMNWQQFGVDPLRAILMGGASGALFGGLCAGVISMFNAWGRGLNNLIAAASHSYFWKFAFTNALFGLVMANMIVGLLSFGKDQTGSSAFQVAGRKLLQPFWTLDVYSWTEGIASLWQWYVCLAFAFGILGVLSTSDPYSEKQSSSEPWYVTLILTLALIVFAFPPTFGPAFFTAMVAVIVTFVLIVIVALFQAMMGAGNMMRKLHTEWPVRFALFYSFIGGASGTFMVIRLGGQNVMVGSLTISTYAIGWAVGSIVAIGLAQMLRRSLGLRWTYQV